MNALEIKGATIFVVDDNRENLKVLVQYLLDIDIDVVPLRSGEELLELLKERLPEMILLDIMMPGGIDGYETCRRLKVNDTTKDIPVLFMSALTDTLDKVSGFNVGAVDYITKPIETEELLSRIHTHLSISRLQKELFEMNTQLEEKVLMRTEELRETNKLLRKEIEERKHTQESLSQSEKKYRELQNNVPVGVFRSTLEGKFISVNQAMTKMLGYNSVDDLMQASIIDIYANIVDRKKVLDEANKDDVVHDYEFLAKRKDGSIFWVSISLRIIYDIEKKVKYYDGIIVDITERKQAEAELKKLNQAIEQSPVCVVITDTEGNIEYLNQHFSKITGYSTKEAIGQNPRILNGGTQPKEHYKVLWETILAGNIWMGEFHNKTSKGDLYWENAIISPVKNEKGQITHFIAVKENITEKKKLWDDLVTAKNKAEESDHLKSAFLKTISHELRTPLNAIIGFSGVIEESMPINEIIDCKNIINKSGLHLLSLIEAIIQISLIESKNMIIKNEEFLISEFMLEIERFINEEITAKNKDILKIINSIPDEFKGLKVVTDRNKLKHVLFELLKNAIKFTDTGAIDYGFKFYNNKEIIFYVNDTGIGISKNIQKIIFERFRQGDDSNTRIHEGLGIGLSIAKQLTETLGGNISVESELGKGSTFYLKVPLKQLNGI